MRRTFLGEGTVRKSSSQHMTAVQKSDVAAWIEVWDYVGGSTFRGFLTTKPDRSLVMFFDKTTIGPDLKSGCVSQLCHSTDMLDLWQ
jgi:hypothetical protein